MRNDLAWSYTLAGALNTINAVGYLIGSILAFASVRRLGAKRPFIVNLWLTAATVLATAWLRDFSSIAFVRLLSGATSAYAFVAGGAVVAFVFPNDVRRSATAIAIYFSGGGLGLFMTAVTLPWLLHSRGDAAWPEAWLLLGVMIAITSLCATIAARPIDVPRGERIPIPWSQRPLLPLIVGYGCFALGYYGYMTFAVAWMREHGASGTDIAIFWGVLGLASILTSRLWARPMATWPGGRPFAAVMATVGVGAAIPLLGGSLPIMLVSAVLYGCFFMVPASLTTYVKNALPRPLWGEAMAAFTLYFSILQCFGPAATGYLADVTGSLAAGLGISAGLLLLGAVAGWTQRSIA